MRACVLSTTAIFNHFGTYLAGSAFPTTATPHNHQSSPQLGLAPPPRPGQHKSAPHTRHSYPSPNHPALFHTKTHPRSVMAGLAARQSASPASSGPALMPVLFRLRLVSIQAHSTHAQASAHTSVLRCRSSQLEQPEI